MNNRNLAFALLAFFAFAKIQAQVTFRPGIQAGVNVSKITDSGLDSKTDFYIGAFGALKLSKFYTLQPEITYSIQGGKGTASMGTNSIYDPQTNSYATIYESGTVNASLQYISALTINKINFNENFYVLAGPFFDILIADDIKVNPADKEGNFNKGEDIDLGLTGGLGYSLKNGIAFEARIKKGLTNAFTNYYTYSDGNNNLVFQFGAAYTFGK
jgi:hypothetical protein